ncbi:MAG TPA: DUF5658 family protein [Candidatus Krumholzibacteria bacterium]|nr:DUF5658 family protein [Candidatus Krumholzibacteria bacterium]HPD70617.1 DUF5658 family protein [Candidatus Krumholzibacteria bacterium]HRY39683.1 DUF5658 family protein [Candidatus Krumholzibacteria bacterium]
MTLDDRRPDPLRESAEEQRRAPADRRRVPTPIFSRFTLRGHRARIRRRADFARGRYVDRSTGGHLGSILLLLIFIVLDAASTLYILERGGSEVNPLMANALDRGVGWFLLIKLAPLPVAFLLLSIHRYFRWVRAALILLVVVYGVLAIHHLALLAKIH